MPGAGLLVRIARAVRAIAAMAAVLVLLAPLAGAPPGSRPARLLALAVWRLILRGFGITVHVHGTPSRAPGTLHVANHVSWADIAVLGRLLDAGFVAKAEVAGWPLIGPAARRYRCLFVAREARAEADGQARQLATRLARGESLILFAEGTTGLGDTVLPFRSTLFAGVGVGQGAVQPVALVWRHRDGTPFTPAERRRFAWIADDDLLPHAAALALSGGALVDVWFDEPAFAPDRKALATTVREAIAARIPSEAR